MKTFKKFDIVSSSTISIGVIVSEIIEVPCFESGTASDFSFIPLDIQNPEEWGQTFEAYIVYDLCNEKYEIVPVQRLTKLDGDVTDGYIPFDHGTGRLRVALGLIKLAEKWYGKNGTPFLDEHLK